MPLGYSYFELWNIKKKSAFLKKNLSDFEKRLAVSFHALSQFVLAFLFISFFISLNMVYVSSALFIFHSILVQNFRRYMYFKYKYYKNDSRIKMILGNASLLIGSLLAIAFLNGFSIFG